MTKTGVLGQVKESLIDYALLGTGAAGVILLGDLTLSRLLVKDGKPLVPAAWTPVVYVGLGILGGELVRRNVSEDLGIGILAGGLGAGVSAIVGLVASKAAKETVTTTSAAETAGAGSQATAGFGFGRMFAKNSYPLQGLGRLGAARSAEREMLFGSKVGAFPTTVRDARPTMGAFPVSVQPATQRFGNPALAAIMQ